MPHKPLLWKPLSWSPRLPCPNTNSAKPRRRSASSGWRRCKRCSVRPPRRICTSSAFWAKPIRRFCRWPRTPSPPSPDLRPRAARLCHRLSHLPVALPEQPVAPEPVLIEAPATPTAPVESALDQPAPTESTPTDTVELGLLLSVVAEKTGYPADMLNGGMDLETDLGIDSIKRVEIFAAVRERAAGLPPT